MARWKLTEPHYLNVPDSRWEHTTSDPRTGKPIRKMYHVPMHLDPRMEDDWNFRVNGMDGEIHVCYAGKGLPNDIVFEGDPTPGMVPLDDEAQQITSKFNWTPTQGIDEQSQRESFYMQMADKLVNQLTDMKADAAMAPQANGMDKFLEAMTALMAQNQQLLERLAGKAQTELMVQPDDELARQAKALGETKFHQEVLPLDDVEPTELELAQATAVAAEKEAVSQQKALNRMAGRRI